MGDLFLLSERQMARISPCFTLAHGVPRVEDRRVVSGIVYVIRNGLQWKDAPKGGLNSRLHVVCNDKAASSTIGSLRALLPP